jgi:hypothetical protein
MIQQLSLLVGFLDWVSPTAPNSNICKSVKEVISRVLDQTLNMANSAAPALDLNWEPGLSTELNDIFNFDLLDTFNWVRPDGSV